MGANLPLGTTGLAVGDNAAANNLSEPLELTSKPLLINVPAQVSDE